MITAKQKKGENIVEYILYMWQVEDLLRACRFERGELEKLVIAKYDVTDDVRYEVREWYAEIGSKMVAEGVAEKGHLRSLNAIVAALQELHQQLLKTSEEEVYQSLYFKTLPSIVQLRSKAGGTAPTEVETCLTAVYGFLLMKMQGREISSDTEAAIKQLSALLALLASKYNY